MFDPSHSVYEHLHSRPKHPTVTVTVDKLPVPPTPEHASEPPQDSLSLPPTRTHWIHDDLVSYCTECTSRFSVFLRKHHCRKCGKIFCSECSKFTGKLDSNAKFNLSGYICRLCLSCYQDFLMSSEGQVCSEAGLLDSPSSVSKASNAVNISLKVDQGSPEQAEAAISPAVPSDWQWSTF